MLTLRVIFDNLDDKTFPELCPKCEIEKQHVVWPKCDDFNKRSLASTDRTAGVRVNYLDFINIPISLARLPRFMGNFAIMRGICSSNSNIQIFSRLSIVQPRHDE